MQDRPIERFRAGPRPPVSIRLVRVRVPLITPHVAAHGSEAVRDVILISWTDESGSAGWAECSTLGDRGYVTESTDEAWSALVERLAPSALEGGSENLEDRSAARSALADAELDAALRGRGESLAEHLATSSNRARGSIRSALPRCVVVADLGAGPDEVARRAELAVQAGAAMVKVKIAPGHDVAVLTEVIARIGSVPVAADANGGYRTLSELRLVDGLGLAYLEQPFPVEPVGAESSTGSIGLETPVALDESVTSLVALERLIERSALDVVSVKPLRMGGLCAAADAVRIASDEGLGVFVGGMVELGLGRAAALGVAALPGCSFPTDLGPSSSYVVDDVCEPIVVDTSGLVVVPGGPGCGRLPDPASLAVFGVADITICR